RTPSAESVLAQSLAEQLKTALRERNIRKPLFHFDGETWKVAAGILLQMRKENRPFAVADYLVLLFEQPARAAGDEDALITVGNPSVHARMLTRPGNAVLAADGDLYVDAIVFSSLESH